MILPARGQQAHHRHQRGGLAAARFTYQPQGLAGINIEGDIFQRMGNLGPLFRFIQADEIGAQVAHAEQRGLLGFRQSYESRYR